MRVHPRTAGLIAILLVATANQAAAQNGSRPDKSRWKCKSCEMPIGWSQDYEAGIIGVSDSSALFGRYTGLNESGGYAAFDLRINYRGNGSGYLDIQGDQLGLDSRFIGVTGGQQGVWDVRGYWDELPRFQFDTTRSPYDSIGSSTLSRPAGWVRAPNTQGMTALPATLRDNNIEQERKTHGLGVSLRPWRNLRLIADYRHTDQEGIRNQPGAFLTAATELTQPIDFQTDEITLGIGYGGSSWDAEINYYGSFFDNDGAGYTWQNLYTPIVGAEAGQHAQPPDNEFQQVALSGAWRGPARTTLTGRVALGRMEQNEQFLPYTTNAGIPTSPLPRQSFAGEVDTTNVYLRATSSPWRPLRLNAEYRLDERDNKSVVDSYAYVVMDAAPGGSVLNLPYGYERNRFALDGDLRIARWLRVALGWGRKETERNLQERATTEADRIWTKARLNYNAVIDATLLLSREERDGSAYESLTGTTAPQNPLMRKYYLADRDRDTFEFRLGMTPSDLVSISFLSRYAEDDYTDTAIGLLRSEDTSWTVDGSIATGGGNALYAAYTREVIESDQANSQNFGRPDWLGLGRDEFDTVVIGFLMPKLAKDKVKLNIDYTWAKSKGEVGIEFANSSQGGPFPNLKTELNSLRLSLDYAWREDLTFRFGYWFESFDSSDWALDGVEPATVNNLVSLGADAHGYDVNTFLVSFVYRPGQ